MDNPIPRGPKDLYCPMWRKTMDKVCHTCPLWMHIKGVNPNTGQEVDRWSCSFAQLPIMMIENAHVGRHVGAAVDALRKEQETRHTEAKQYTVASIRQHERVERAVAALAEAPVLIESRSADDENR